MIPLRLTLKSPSCSKKRQIKMPLEPLRDRKKELLSAWLKNPAKEINRLSRGDSAAWLSILLRTTDSAYSKTTSTMTHHSSAKKSEIPFFR